MFGVQAIAIRRTQLGDPRGLLNLCAVRLVSVCAMAFPGVANYCCVHETAKRAANCEVQNAHASECTTSGTHFLESHVA